MNSKFNVVFTGVLKPGTDHDAFIKAFSQRFQCSEEKAAQLLESDKAVTMKSAVAKDVAEKFRDILEELGMMVRLEPLPSSPSPAPSQEAAPASANPYQAPEAQLEQPYVEGEMTGPVSVPFGHGFSWISQAFSNHFKANPGPWIGTFLVFFVMAIVMQIIPLIGPLGFALLSPVFTAGFMIGSHAQTQGEDFTFNHLFSGFKQAGGQLILVGLLYMVGSFVIGIVIAIVLGGSLAMSGAFSGNDQAMAQEIAQNPAFMLVPMLIMLGLLVPLLMSYWFAPALVALDGVSALTAMKMSFMGCLKNILPFLLYGIVMFVLSVVAVIPVGLGLLVLFPVMLASMYTAYRDIYYSET